MKKQRRQLASGNPFDNDDQSQVSEYTFQVQTAPAQIWTKPQPQVQPQYESVQVLQKQLQTNEVNDIQMKVGGRLLSHEVPNSSQSDGRVKPYEAFGTQPPNSQSQNLSYQNMLVMETQPIHSDQGVYEEQNQPQAPVSKTQVQKKSSPPQSAQSDRPPITIDKKSIQLMDSPDTLKSQEQNLIHQPLVPVIVPESSIQKAQRLLQQTQQLLKRKNHPEQQQIIQPIQSIQPILPITPIKQNSTEVKNDVQLQEALYQPIDQGKTQKKDYSGNLSEINSQEQLDNNLLHKEVTQYQLQNSEPLLKQKVQIKQPFYEENIQKSNNHLNEETVQQDFEFVFIIKNLNKQQREEHLRTISKIWENIGDQSQNNTLLFILAQLMNKLLIQADSNFLDEDSSELRNQIINLLQRELKQEFVQSYEELFNNSQNWETILLIGMGFQQNQIETNQQEILNEYLSKRAYKNQEEAIILLATGLLKMEASDIKTQKLLQLHNAITEDQSYTQFSVQLLWISLKSYPKYINRKNLEEIAKEIQNNLKSQDYETYFNSLLIFNILSNGSITNTLIKSAKTFNHLGFLETQAVKFQKPLSGQFYHKLAEKCIEKQKQKAALEFLKHAIELGHTDSNSLREQLILGIHNQNNVSTPVQQPFVGLFDTFKSVIQKTVKTEPIKFQENEKEQFYYDKQQKGWVINGKLTQQDEEIEQKNVQTQNISLPPSVTQIQSSQKTQFVEEKKTPQQQFEPNKEQPSQQILGNPFNTQVNVVQDATRQKKSNLLRNRYVQ